MNTAKLRDLIIDAIDHGWDSDTRRRAERLADGIEEAVTEIVRDEVRSALADRDRERRIREENDA